MSRRDHQDLMLEYLYDELPQTERQAFEARIASDEALAAEVESFRSTRLLLQKSESVEPPQAIFDDLMRQARHAAADATEEKPGFFARLAGFLMQPAAATAALVCVLTVTGVYLARQDKAPGIPTGNSSISGVSDNRDYEDDELADLERERPAAEAPVAAPESILEESEELDEDDGWATNVRGSDRKAELKEVADEVSNAPSGGLFRSEVADKSKTDDARAVGTGVAIQDAEPEPTVEKMEVAALPIPSPAAEPRSGRRNKRGGKAQRVWAAETPVEQAAGNEDDGVDVAVGALAGSGAAGDSLNSDGEQETSGSKVTASAGLRATSGKKRALVKTVSEKKVAKAGGAKKRTQGYRLQPTDGKRREVASQSAQPQRALNLGQVNGVPAAPVDVDDAEQVAEGAAEQVAPQAPKGRAGTAETLVEADARQNDAPVARDVTVDSRNRQRSDSGRYGNVAPAADQAPPGQVVYDAPAEPRPTRASQPMPKKGPVTLAKVAGTVQTKDQKKDQKKEESRRPGTVVAYDRAMDHYRQERYGKAITGFESYLKEAEGGQADAQARLAKSYARTNQVKQAAARYRKLLKDNPNYRSRSTVLIELARLESLMGNLAEARALLKQAAKDKSVATRAKQRLADIERRLKVQTKRAAAKKAKAKASKKAAPQKAAPAKADKPYEPAKK